MKTSLFEGIVGTAQSPTKFWLVLDIPNSETRTSDDEWNKVHNDREDKIIANIAKGELEGVKGISDSRRIITEWWLMARNAVIMMDANKVIELNDIEKISYDDPEGLCANNMAMLYRMWDKNPDNRLGRSGLMLNLMQYIVGEIAKMDHNLGHMLSYYGVASKMSSIWEHAPLPVHDMHSVAKALKTMMDQIDDHYIRRVLEADMTDDMLFYGLRNALKKVGGIYSDESEWIVHSSHLKIPPKSVMLVGVRKRVIDNYEDWKINKDKMEYFSTGFMFENYERLMAKIEQYGLNDYYQIKYVDSDRFEAMRPDVMSKRREAASRVQ